MYRDIKKYRANSYTGTQPALFFDKMNRIYTNWFLPVKQQRFVAGNPVLNKIRVSSS